MTALNNAPRSTSRDRKQRHREMLDELDESTRRIDDREAIERLIAVRDRKETLKRRLSSAHGADAAAAIMQSRRDCVHHVTTVMACAESLAIIDGVIVIKCTYADVLQSRIAKFNQHRGGRLSPAAHVYRMLQKGTL